jgi:SAM-dependent methyltransferase
MDVVFEEFVQEAMASDLSGWDFTHWQDRWVDEPPSWDYRAMVEQELPGSISLLDMGTGGGEFLSSLKPLPMDVCATESYGPNIPVSRKNLEPLGVRVVSFEEDDHLPFDDDRFDLVINRHESFSPPELYRILKPGGTFITQQVGGRDNAELNALLGAPVGHEYHDWDLKQAVAGLEQNGFRVSESLEEFPKTTFYDIGAIVFYLKAISWQIPGFRLADYREPLFDLYQRIQSRGPLVLDSHRFFIKAQRPEHL